MPAGRYVHAPHAGADRAGYVGAIGARRTGQGTSEKICVSICALTLRPPVTCTPPLDEMRNAVVESNGTRAMTEGWTDDGKISDAFAFKTAKGHRLRRCEVLDYLRKHKVDGHEKLARKLPKRSTRNTKAGGGAAAAALRFVRFVPA